jgi:hypothetical protein
MICTKTSPWNRRLGKVFHPDAVPAGASWRCPHCGLLTDTKPFQKFLLPCAKCNTPAGWGGTEIHISVSCRKYCWSAVHYVEDEVAENEPQHEALLNYWNELQQTYPRFQELRIQWHKEVCFTSSSSVIAANSNYREIVSLGDIAVPLILDDLRTNGPDHWFYALAELTGADPIPKEHAGMISEMTLDWLEWAEEKTYAEEAYDKPTIDLS